jgi:hypothetical protein
MTHGRSLSAALIVASALALPASAAAACATRPLEQVVRETPVVVTAQAQPGPLARNGIGLLSPAAFRAVAYDQGSGSQEIKVQTALSTLPDGELGAAADGVNPVAGQTWRLWGSFSADGVLQTSVCNGSTLAAQTPPVLGGTALRPASIAGAARSGALPTITARRGAKVVLKVAVKEANVPPVSAAVARSLVAVRMKRGAATAPVALTWKASDGQLVAKLRTPASGSAIVIVITRAASFAARVRAS